MKMMGVSAAILAGGKSSRMGTNKSLLLLDGKSVIERISNSLQDMCNECFIIANDQKPYEQLGMPIYQDDHPGQGPLAGLEAALIHAKSDLVLLAACDMPFADPAVYRLLLDQLGGADAAVPVYAGRMHPLSGLYRKTALPAVQSCLEQGNLRMKSFLNLIQTKELSHFPELGPDILDKHFFNMNTPEEYEAAKRILT